MKALVAAWQSLDVGLQALIGASVIASLLHYRQRMHASCDRCGGKLKKTHDTLLIERMTDAITPRWQYERDRSPGVFKCQNCGHERKYL